MNFRYYKPIHFEVQELVSPEIYKKYGDDAIKVFDPRILWTIDKIREYYGVPVYINNWDMKKPGNKTQSGFRTVIDPNTPLTLHRGAAIDFVIKGVSPAQFRKDVRSGKLASILVYITRVEDNTPTWNHIDCANVPGTEIIFFKV